MKKKLSISDVAQNLGISVTTVSFILNGKAKERRISDAVARRVLDYAKKVGYTLSPKRNRATKAKTIALFIDDYTNVLYTSIAREVELAAYDLGYHVLLCSLSKDSVHIQEIIHQLCDQQIDGFLIFPKDGMDDCIQYLLNKKVPLVLLGSYIAEIDTNYVVCEDSKGVVEGTLSLFVDRKASKVGFIGTNANQVQMKKRLEGYMSAIDQVGGDFSIKKINAFQSEDAIIDEIRDFIVDNKLDGVFFAANSLAVAGLKSIRKYDLTIRGIASFDDNPVFELVSPAVSAVAQNVPEIGRQAVVVLVDEIKGLNRSLVHIIVPCEFINR